MGEYDIVEMINAAVDEYADRPAVVGDERTLTYRDIEHASNRPANFLLANGAAPADRVIVLARDPFFTIRAILGALKAGCAFVPLDVRLPKGRLRAMVRLARPRWCLCQTADLPLLTDITPLGLAGLKTICEGGAPDGEPPAEFEVLRAYGDFSDTSRPSVEADGDLMCYIYFTSGSTGEPKAIAGRFKAIGHFVRWEIDVLGLAAGVRVSQLTTPSFDAYMRDVFTPLAAGGAVCIPPSYATVWNPPALVRYLAGSGVNVLHCVPGVLRGLLRAAEPGALPSLRYVLSAGDALFPSDVRRWYEVFGDGARLVNLYGPSETTMTKFYHFVRPEDAEGERVSVGRPMPDTEAVIVGDGRVCPPGVVGEIYIRTPFAALGYFARPGMTRESFVPDTFGGDPAGVVYRTGDLGMVLDDGNLDLMGRGDRQVNLGGLRTELGEVESLILASGEVDEASVVDFGDAPGEKYLHAYLVARKGLDPERLCAALADRLHPVAVPRGFTVLERLPRTITGKVDRRALPPPVTSQPGEAAAVEDGVEALLVKIWRRLFKTDRVSPADDFFELGGDSLRATMTAARLAQHGIDVPLRAVFEYPVLRDLAVHIESLGGKGVSS